MRDGVRLRTDVFRPAGSDPRPTLVQRYPYRPHDGIWSMIGKVIAPLTKRGSAAPRVFDA